MTKFRFRLATLQKLREAHRDQMRSKLAEAYQAEQILAQQIEALHGEAASLQQTQRASMQTTATNVNQLLNTQRYQSVLRSQIAAMKEQTQMLVAEIEKRRQALVEADQQVRVLDKLKKRQLAVHRHDQQQAETKAMDEIASRRQEAR